jgi:hypothetical protein
MVYHRDADSWNSSNELPKAVFLDRDAAEGYASKQPGYGLNVDWFVKDVPLNPEVNMSEWADDVVKELDEQYNVPANVEGNIVKKVEIDLPGKHYLDITNHSLYGFIVTLTICDETGGVIAEKELLIGVKREDLASDVAGIYNSYE